MPGREEGYTVQVLVSESRRLLLSRLSGPAPLLWTWVQQQLKPGQNYIEINRKTFLRETGYQSPNTYKKARDLLLYHKLLYPTRRKDVFWVNTNFITAP
ncbi:hypothetical protein CLV58_12548 [Spirosoma oryzae]|uniref:Uncharacterized protein n=2 Tax=Spirosoma oryzae TaxID=1469603 RepID=A0A2T0S8S1_9BACT|nr:hypothetical protein CLV58_12548 [Spirosoma oryzae]